MSTADFEIQAELDRADAIMALADLQHAAMLAKAMDVVNGKKWEEPVRDREDATKGRGVQ